MYDTRLFNQSSGIASGFTQNDAYNLYDKPLFQGSSANSIYKPNIAQHAAVDEQLENMVKKGKNVAIERDGPVQFEKEDLFGMDAFMNAAKRGGDGEQGDTKRQKK
jgi:SNW domain-containing protein 1